MEFISSLTHTVIKRLSKYTQSSEADLGALQEPFVTTINGFEPLTIIKKGSMLHVTQVLDVVESLALVEAVKTLKFEFKFKCKIYLVRKLYLHL